MVVRIVLEMLSRNECFKNVPAAGVMLITRIQLLFSSVILTRLLSFLLYLSSFSSFVDLSSDNWPTVNVHIR